jgi:hypothetical protein
LSPAFFPRPPAFGAFPAGFLVAEDFSDPFSDIVACEVGVE